MTLARRAGLAVFGLILILLGLVLFLMMCGSNAHVAGAFGGGLGGAFLGVRRRLARVRWFAAAGGVLLALLGTGMEYLATGSCAGVIAALGSGSLTGFGIGLLVDGARGVDTSGAA